MFDGLLGESWDVLRREPAPTRGSSLMDIVLDRGSMSLSSLTFGRFVDLPIWDGPVPADPPPDEAPSAAASQPAALISPKLKMASARVHPAEEEALHRTAAVRSWMAIVEALKGSTNAFIELRGAVDEEAMLPYLATRRTGTLATRASAWRLFCRWADDSELELECADEPMAFAYLKHLKAVGAPPTRGESFLKFCHLAFGLLGFAAGQKIATSPR